MMRKQPRKLSNSSVLNALFPATRRDILSATLPQPNKWWYLSELAHYLGTTPSSLQRELALLASAGILEERRNGTRNYFRPRQASPTYRNLRGIFDDGQQKRKRSRPAAPEDGLDLLVLDPREGTAADHGEICNLRSEHAPPATPSDISAISVIPNNEKEHHMKKTRTSPEKAAAMDQDAVLAAKNAEHENRSAGSKKAWVTIHAKKAAAKAAAEAENRARTLVVPGPVPENRSSAVAKRTEPPSRFKGVISDLLRESPKTFKQLYPMIAQRQPENCPVAPSTNGKMVNPAAMEWLQQIHRDLHEIAVFRDGIWYLKGQILPQICVQSIDNTDKPFLGRAGKAETKRATTGRTAYPAENESKANLKSRKAPGVRAKEGGSRLKRGAATQVMVYPRPETKAVLVRAARNHDQALSSFLILAGLEKTAALEGCTVEDLVPEHELRQYV